jgi:hypothetical protein
VQVPEITDVPTVAILGKAVQLQKEWGKGLKEKNLKAVYGLVCKELETAGSITEHLESLKKFITYLEEDAEARNKFFLYTDTLLTLLE